MTAPRGLRLARKARLRWDRHANVTFLLLPEKAIRLNGTATEILRACDGTLGVDGLAAAISARAPRVDAEAVKKDVASFIAEMRARGVVEESSDADPEG
jgi:coenzyme PQQ biosynthesis protein PqqD